MNTQSQTSHDTRMRGPGMLFIASNVVIPLATAKRPSSTCTKTLMIQPMTISQSRSKPASAASFGVAITSPEPTIEAVRISPGPTCRKICPKLLGASCGESMGAD